MSDGLVLSSLLLIKGLILCGSKSMRDNFRMIGSQSMLMLKQGLRRLLFLFQVVASKVPSNHFVQYFPVGRVKRKISILTFRCADDRRLLSGLMFDTSENVSRGGI